MISAGGKYWPAAGIGAAKAASASAAANRTALAVSDAFLAGDPLTAQRDLSTRQPAQEIPSGAAPTNSPIRVAGSPACALKPRVDDFLRIAPKNRPMLTYHILRENRKISQCGAKNKEAAIETRGVDRRGVGRAPSSALVAYGALPLSRAKSSSTGPWPSPLCSRR
jgi:hypothetical protein